MASSASSSSTAAIPYDTTKKHAPPVFTYTPEQLAVLEKLKDELDLPEWAENDDKLLLR
jgi:hypothetical protein